jgi:type VI secretion system secreted protein Hcp
MPFDAYLWIKGVEGESLATGLPQKGCIDIISFSFGASNPSTVSSGKSGLSAGKVHVGGFNIMKKMDAASNVLFAHCCTGDHFNNAEVFMRKATGKDGGQKIFLNYKFEHVMVDSIQWSGSSGGDDSPTESVQFAFANFTTTYHKQGMDGKSMTPVGPVGWDLNKNAKV